MCESVAAIAVDAAAAATATAAAAEHVTYVMNILFQCVCVCVYRIYLYTYRERVFGGQLNRSIYCCLLLRNDTQHTMCAMLGLHLFLSFNHLDGDITQFYPIDFDIYIYTGHLVCVCVSPKSRNK